MITIVHNDVMARDLEFDDSLLEPSFADLIDAWTMTSSFVTSRQLPEHHRNIPAYVTDWSVSGFPAWDSRYDVTDPNMALMTSHNTDDSGFYQYGEEWNPAGNPVDDVRDHVTVESSGVPQFTDDQVVCICRSLQQKGDIDKLEAFLSTLPYYSRCSSLACRDQFSRDSHRLCDVLPVSSQSPAVRQPEAEVLSAVVSSAAHVAYERGRYGEVKELLSSHQFAEIYHESLQHLWYETHYSQLAAQRRHRTLGAVDKYRIRRKYPPPQTIWDGQQTVYCFKVVARKLLLDSYTTCRYPSSEERRSIARRTGLTVTQVSNWFKNRRQRHDRYH